MLSSKFKTYATPKNVNSDIGVAINILENINQLADVYIVEMGAYKRGEIRDICDITKPDIAVITSIASQHLALFGSIENVLKAKYEIVEYSKPKAKIILNGDSDLVLRIAGKSKKKEILYSINKQLNFWVSDIKSKKEKIEFNVHEKQTVVRFEARMLGEYNISNILAATSVARELGMSLNEIAVVLKKGTKRKKIGKLSIRRSRFGYKFIDDSYNSNVAGFQAAL
ncbi:Mur ligase family protein, partial [Romboutsia sp.]|uniref:Mur ligase family protein n=1 Tax=Romboutsia sp. TaxID=1965302 RepID=UPI002BB392E6